MNLKKIAGLASALLISGVSAWAQPCLTGYTVTASPQPVNGTYACGETVTFCFTVTFWNSTNANWFQGITASFGPGWDLSTLTPGAPPATCGGSGGNWGWYNLVQGTAGTNIGPTGPGFFFDLNNDGNPGNNFGDFCVGAVDWEFCWTISVLSAPACTNGTSLAVTFNTLSDSQTGGWSGVGCGGDVNPPAFPGPVVIQSCTVSAGSAGILDLCNTAPPADLFSQLGGTPDAGGTWTDPSGAAHSGQFVAGTDLPGAYTYTVTSVAPPCSVQASVNVAVQPQPDAGVDGATTVCASDAPFALISVLGGTPDGTGTWSDPSGALSLGTLDPATAIPGTYTYTVTGIVPCTSSSANVSITINASPNAGVNGAASICSNGAPILLFNSLGGTPSAGGTWTGPGGVPFSGSYDPTLNAPGIHTYTVNGTAPCPNSTATVTVVENALPQAGTSATANFCSTDPIVDLTALLGGTPDVNGSWADPAGNVIGTSLTPSGAASGVYTYTVSGAAPCPDAQATLDLAIAQQPTAGTGGVLNLCEASAAVDLSTQLSGSPDAGGVWTGPNGLPTTPVFTPASSVPGAYTYTVAATAPCLAATAQITVNVTAEPDAGSNASLSVCSSGLPAALFPQLGANAQVGGTWTDPGGLPFTGTFTPGSSPDGVYTYTISAAAPCTDASATVTVSTVQAGNPGTGSPLALCGNGAPVDLNTSLAGNPQAGGSWTTPTGAAFNGTLNPAAAQTGDHTYTIAANGPCPSASTTVAVTIVAPPNAGASGTASLCTSSNASYSLIDALGGSPAATGSWTDPYGAPHGADVQPASAQPGIYTYTVNGTAPCASSSSTVTLSIVQAASAGVGSSIALCANGAPLDPTVWLSGTPDAGGTWTSPNGSTVGTVDPSTAPSGNYTYTVNGIAPCPDVQAVVALTVDVLPNAGSDATLDLCADAPAVPLATLLGAADPGGTWQGPSGAATGSFQPGVNIPGTYIYTVLGEGACIGTQDQSSVETTVSPLPVPVFAVSIASGCAPLQVLVTNADPGGADEALWSFGDGLTSTSITEEWHTYDAGGSFDITLQITDANGCVGTTTLNNAVLVSSGPSALFSVQPMRVSVEAPEVTISSDPDPLVDHVWDIGGVTLDTTGIFPWVFDQPEVGYQEICMTATDTLGCSNTECLQILIDDVLTVFVPNAFTPNGDDRNEVFLPSIIGLDVEQYEFNVFDRWGLLVFTTEDPQMGWNGSFNNSGEILPQDVYVWTVQAKDQFTPERKDLIGTVTLVK